MAIAVGLIVALGPALYAGIASASTPFTTGTLNLGIASGAPVFSVSGMVPGDVRTERLRLSNAGTLDLRYAMTTMATGDCSGLCDLLQLEIREPVGGSCADFSGAVVVSRRVPREHAESPCNP